MKTILVTLIAFGLAAAAAQASTVSLDTSATAKTQSAEGRYVYKCRYNCH